MFTDNEKLCTMVPESDVVQMFHLASTSFDPGHYELFTTLKAMILVSLDHHFSLHKPDMACVSMNQVRLESNGG